MANKLSKRCTKIDAFLTNGIARRVVDEQTADKWCHSPSNVYYFSVRSDS